MPSIPEDQRVQRKAEPHRRSWIKNLALLLGSVCFLLLLLNGVYVLVRDGDVGETTTRVTISRRSDLPGVRHEYIPGVRTTADGVEVAINALGFRDREFPPEKPDGTCRIVALGDSITFGQGVPLADTYPKQLEALLRGSQDDGHAYEVLNAGVQGYNTLQEAAVLRHRILPLQPDLLLLGFTETNDPEIESLRAFSLRDRLREHAPVVLKVPLFNYLAARVERKLTDEDWYRFTQEIYAPEGKPWRACREALRDIRDLCADHGVELLVVLFPCLYHEDVFRSQREQLEGTLEALSMPYLETFPLLAEIPAERLHVSETDHHPSAWVHRRFAEAIHERLAENPPCTRRQPVSVAHRED